MSTLKTSAPAEGAATGRLLPMICRRALLPAAILTAAAWASTVPAEAAQELNGDFPVSGTFPNPCNGETVPLSGVAHVVINSVTNSGGGATVDEHVNLGLSGTGSLGNSYTGSDVAHTVFHVPDSSSFTTTTAASVELITIGPAPNFVEKGLLHITVDNNSITTADFVKLTESCRG